VVALHQREIDFIKTRPKKIISAGSSKGVLRRICEGCRVSPADRRCVWQVRDDLLGLPTRFGHSPLLSRVLRLSCQNRGDRLSGVEDPDAVGLPPAVVALGSDHTLVPLHAGSNRKQYIRGMRRIWRIWRFEYTGLTD
jgi:hypothetical protein